MRLATFNTFWLGTPEVQRIPRTEEDEDAIVRLLGQLNADLLLFQEVVSFPLLEELLGKVRPGYRLRDAEGNWLTTGRMRSRVSHLQKIALAYDHDVMELKEVSRPFSQRWPGPREPLLARFVERRSSQAFGLVGLHLKSGGLRLPPDSVPATVRGAECETLADWLRAEERADEALIVMGDFNASREHPSLAPLRTLEPRFRIQTPMVKPDRAGEHWSSFGERSIIDLAITSPAATARVVGAPEIVAFDLDPEFDRPRGEVRARVEDHFLRRKTDLLVEVDEDRPLELVENIYRISDHRPLVITLD